MQKPHCGMQNKYTKVWKWNGSKAATVSFQSMHYTSSCIKREPTALQLFFSTMIILYQSLKRDRERGREKKNTTFKHLNLAASFPLIACTKGRAFGDFSISKNEEHAFSRAHVIRALKSYRAHIKKDSRLHPIESLQLQPLQKSIQQAGGQNI